MNNRRDFFKTVAGATAGMYVMGGGRAAAQARRQVSIAGKRVRVVDVHAHTDVPLGEVVKGTKYQNQADQDPELEERIPLMDKQGVDVQALSINGFWWYEIMDRGLARAVCNRQNEELAKWVRRTRIVSWRWRPCRCSSPISPRSCCRTRSRGWAHAASRSAVT